MLCTPPMVDCVVLVRLLGSQASGPLLCRCNCFAEFSSGVITRLVRSLKDAWFKWLRSFFEIKCIHIILDLYDTYII